jgi:cysteine synthase
MTYSSILDAIVHISIAKINKLNPNQKVELYPKLEGYNPGG